MSDSSASNHGPEDLLLQCLALPPRQRADQLAALAAANPGQAAMLQRLYAELDCFGLVEEPPEDDDPTSPPTLIGPYQLGRPLGSGGMGTVYLAAQKPLGRLVALKLLLPGAATTTRAIERFRREIQAISLLDHPNICPVYDAGEQDGVLFLAMRFIDGPTLAQRIETARRTISNAIGNNRSSPSEIEATVQLGEKLALALHHAHEKGLVHRDVKPGNVLLDQATGEPQLVDFGLARIDDATTPTLTRSGDRIGTPAYMAPEQVQGGFTDRRTDVYALAATLYEALTLRLPHEAATREELYRRILDGEVAPARRANPAISRDLGIVLATALECHPERRYATARAFADDLRAVRLRQPIQARPTGTWRRLARQVHRHPVLATATLLLVAGVCTAFTLLQQRTQALAAAAQALASAQAHADALRANELANGDPTAALRLAFAAYGQSPNPETLSSVYNALVRHHERQRFGGQGGYAYGGEFYRQGMGICLTTGTKAVGYGPNGEEEFSIHHHDTIRQLVLGPDKHSVLTVSNDGSAIVRHPDGNQVRLSLPNPRSQDRSMTSFLRALRDPDAPGMQLFGCFSPDGQRVLLLGSDRQPRVHDARDGRLLAQQPRAGLMHAAAWSVDGGIATAEGHDIWPTTMDNFAVRIWSAADPERLEHEFHVPGSVNRVEFAPAGDALVAAVADGTARIWELPSGREVVLPAGNFIWHSSWLPDGERILTCARDGRIALWHRSGVLLQACHQRGAAYQASVLPCGTRFLVTCADQSVRLYDEQLRELILLRGHRDHVHGSVVSQCGTRALSDASDGTVRLWQLYDKDVPCLMDHPDRAVALAEDNAGYLWSVGFDRTLRRWDLATGRAERTLSLADWPWSCSLAPDSGHLLANLFDATTVRIDLSAAKPLRRLPQKTGGWGGAAVELRDGRIIQSGRSGKLQQWLPDAAEPIPFADAGTEVVALARSPADLIAASGNNGYLYLWQPDGTRLRRWLAHDNLGVGPLSLTFAPDAGTLATSGNDGSITLWPIQGAGPDRRVQRCVGHEGQVRSLAYSPDGRWLASGAKDGTCRLWSADGKLQAILRTPRGAGVNAVLFSRDGRFLWTADDDGRIQAWPVSVDHLLALARSRLANLPAETPAPEDPVRLRRLHEELQFGSPEQAARLAAELLASASSQGNDNLAHQVALALSRDEEPLCLRDPTLTLRAAELAVHLSQGKNAAQWTLLARIQATHGSLAAAIDHLQKAIALEPSQSREKTLAIYLTRAQQEALQPMDPDSK